MTADHPNVSLLNRLDLRNLADAADLFAPDFVWHYLNPALPDIHGDYFSLEGLQTFFKKNGGMSGGIFNINRISISALGDELVVVWRIVNGQLAEAWDIPAINTMTITEGTDDAAA